MKKYDRQNYRDRDMSHSPVTGNNAAFLKSLGHTWWVRGTQSWPGQRMASIDCHAPAKAGGLGFAYSFEKGLVLILVEYHLTVAVMDSTL